MYCIDTAEMTAIMPGMKHIEGVTTRDVQLLAPLIVGIRAEKNGNGDGRFKMNSGEITQREKLVLYPDEHKKVS